MWTEKGKVEIMQKRMISYVWEKRVSLLIAIFSILFLLLENHTSSLAVEIQCLSFSPPSIEKTVPLTKTEPETEPLPANNNHSVHGEYPRANTQPLPVRPIVAAKAAVAGGFTYSEDIPLDYTLQEFLYNTCVKRNLEYEFVLALIWRESRFQIDAININTNGTQDSGLMQINDINKEWLKEQYGINNLMDPQQNIEAGTIMLSTFVEKYGEHDALMAYQYGEQGMSKKFQEGVITNDLIRQLVERRNLYRELLETT